MERPKYLEYRHRRDQVTRYTISREVKATLEKPAAKLLRLVGKKMSATNDSYNEELTMELRISDVRPDWSGLVKSQVTSAKRTVKDEEVGSEGLSDPTTEFLNERVDRFGQLTEISGTLPTPHILLFPDEPMKTGDEWTRSRKEMLPLCGPDGSVGGHEEMEVTYRCRVDAYGDDGVEYADISLTGTGARGGKETSNLQEYEVGGNVRFAIRDGYIIHASIARQMKSYFDIYILTRLNVEQYQHADQDTEKTVGGMRL